MTFGFKCHSGRIGKGQQRLGKVDPMLRDIGSVLVRVPFETLEREIILIERHPNSPHYATGPRIAIQFVYTLIMFTLCSIVNIGDDDKSLMALRTGIGAHSLDEVLRFVP